MIMLKVTAAKWLFSHGFKFQSFVRNGCRDTVMKMLCLNIDNIVIISVERVFMTVANLKQFIF